MSLAWSDRRALGAADWNYVGDITKQAEAIWCVKTEMTYGGPLERVRRAKVAFGIGSFWLTRGAAQALGEHAGVLVGDVGVGSPAEQAGIRGYPGGRSPEYFNGDPYWLGGDVIVSVDGVRLTRPSQLRTIIERHEPGDVIRLRLWREGRARPMSLKVRLGALPST